MVYTTHKNGDDWGVQPFPLAAIGLDAGSCPDGQWRGAQDAAGDRAASCGGCGAEGILLGAMGSIGCLSAMIFMGSWRRVFFWSFYMSWVWSYFISFWWCLTSMSWCLMIVDDFWRMFDDLWMVFGWVDGCWMDVWAAELRWVMAIRTWDLLGLLREVDWLAVQIRLGNGGFHSHGGTPIAGWFIWWKLPQNKNGWLGVPPWLSKPLNVSCSCGRLNWQSMRTFQS